MLYGIKISLLPIFWLDSIEMSISRPFFFSEKDSFSQYFTNQYNQYKPIQTKIKTKSNYYNLFNIIKQLQMFIKLIKIKYKLHELYNIISLTQCLYILILHDG